AIHVDGVRSRVRLAEVEPRGTRARDGGLHGVHRSARQGRRAQSFRSPSVELERDDGACDRREGAGARRRRTGTPNWRSVLELYEALFEMTRSPIVAVNRALVIAELEGPKAGLEAIDRIGDARLTPSHQTA